MSVQAGIWNFDGAPVARDILERISRQTAEFGPDGEGLHIDGNIGMLYRPFHTTTESVHERQPHFFANGKVMTWDGRLDNREELISLLGEPLSTRSNDADIVAMAYEQWGCNSFAKLVGDWALAIWNCAENRLILARDYIGVRRLFYAQMPAGIIWCNHLAPLVLRSPRLTLSEEYIARYLALDLRGNLTPFRELRSVPPGHFISIDQRIFKLHRHWTFNWRNQVRYKKDREYEERFLYLFRQSVRRRLRSQSPILSDLSGGLDSSSIVCVADEISKDSSFRVPPVDTLSYYYFDEPESEDRLYVGFVEAQRSQAGHHVEVRGRGDSFAVDGGTFLPVPIFGARKEVETARLELMRAKGYRVALSGLGGDEFLGRAVDARVNLADLLVRLRWLQLAPRLFAWARIWRYPIVKLLLETVSAGVPHRIHANRKDKTQGWMVDRFDLKGIPAGVRFSIKGQRLWLPGARDWHDTHSRLAGILTNLPVNPEETSYPCLDQSLVEFLMSIPRDQLLRPGERRSLMRRALVGIVPSEILARRTKQLEGRCYITTLAKHWKELDQLLDDPIAARFGILHGPEFKAALRSLATKGRLTIEGMQMLRGLFLELWLRSIVRHAKLAMPDAAETLTGPGRMGNEPQGLWQKSMISVFNS